MPLSLEEISNNQVVELVACAHTTLNELLQPLGIHAPTDDATLRTFLHDNMCSMARSITRAMSKWVPFADFEHIHTSSLGVFNFTTTFDVRILLMDSWIDDRSKNVTDTISWRWKVVVNSPVSIIGANMVRFTCENDEAATSIGSSLYLLSAGNCIGESKPFHTFTPQARPPIQ